MDRSQLKEEDAQIEEIKGTGYPKRIDHHQLCTLRASCYNTQFDKMEDWDVKTSEIIGVYLQNDYYKEDIHINMEGEMVNLLEEIYPS